MIKARFLRSATLEELRGSIKQNLNTYRAGVFSDLSADNSFWFESRIKVDDHALSLLSPTDGWESEAQNCQRLHDAIDGVTPYEARDERLWTYLTHTLLLEHGRKRWPIPDDDDAAVNHIARHFFARSKRDVERENVAARLWWMAHLCGRVKSMTRENALQAFLFRSDVRANIVERPTTSQCSELFSVLMEKLFHSYSGSRALFERKTFRTFMIEINSVGGYKLLDCLPSEEISEILDEIISVKLGIACL